MVPRSASGSSSDSDSDSLESGSGSSTESMAGTGRVSLDLQKLESLHALGSLGDTELSQFAKNGLSEKRLKEALRHPGCPCKCSMPWKPLAKVVRAFWNLTKTAQDAVLWNMQAEAGDRAKQWTIEGLS